VFRELGHPAAFVYEALEHTRGRPERSFDLVTRTGLSRTAVYEALETLAARHLVEPCDGRWVLVPGTSLQQLAEQFGCADTVRALLNRHRDERTRYRRAMRIVDQHHLPTLRNTDGYLWPPPEPPPDDQESLLELLERELGAHPKPVGA
jgi:hypothetical protein